MPLALEIEDSEAVCPSGDAHAVSAIAVKHTTAIALNLVEEINGRL